MSSKRHWNSSSIKIGGLLKAVGQIAFDCLSINGDNGGKGEKGWQPLKAKLSSQNYILNTCGFF